MAKRHSVNIDNRTLSLGDTLEATEAAAHEGHGEVGEFVRVHIIKERSSGSFLIGLINERRNENWSNLDGEVASGHGYFFRRRDVFTYFTPVSTERMSVKDSFMFRKLELQGMECDILAFLPDGTSVFVQFDKDVGGCASDGLGKAGHCLAVPKAILKEARKDKNKKKKA